MNIYRIKSDALKARGEKFETADRKRAEARLALIRSGKSAVADPDARILIIPSQGR